MILHVTGAVLCPHGRSLMLLFDGGGVRQAEPCEVCDRIAALALYQVACEAWGLVGRLAARDIVLLELTETDRALAASPPYGVLGCAAERRLLAMLHILKGGHRG